ncbi:MAG TPA: hypothetical protein VK943_10390 [Arenibaculum sp.]|nr:hypothetical protein [Arenibaculum sp.]
MVLGFVAIPFALACLGLSFAQASPMPHMSQAVRDEARPAAAEISVGDLVYRVVEVDWRDELAFQTVRYDTRGAFLVVRYSVRNTGSRVTVLHEPRLEDTEGAVHEASWKGWVLPLSFDRFEAVVPGAERTFSVAFEVERRDGHIFIVETGGQAARLPLDLDPVDGPAV